MLLRVLHSTTYRNVENSNINATNLPTELGLLSNLKSFFVWSMIGDGGTVPTELGRLTMLEQLHIRGSQYYGEIPTEFGLLTMLDSLVLDGGKLEGTSNDKHTLNMVLLFDLTISHLTCSRLDSFRTWSAYKADVFVPYAKYSGRNSAIRTGQLVSTHAVGTPLQPVVRFDSKWYVLRWN
jgi:hypothetical protein